MLPACGDAPVESKTSPDESLLLLPVPIFMPPLRNPAPVDITMLPPSPLEAWELPVLMEIPPASLRAVPAESNSDPDVDPALVASRSSPEALSAAPEDTTTLPLSPASLCADASVTWPERPAPATPLFKERDPPLPSPRPPATFVAPPT